MSKSTELSKTAIEQARQARIAGDARRAAEQTRIAEQHRVADIVRKGLDLKR